MSVYQFKIIEVIICDIDKHQDFKHDKKEGLKPIAMCNTKSNGKCYGK